ncbi:hypothetical protein D5F01_LYC03672 [Larimichthys crocea]|uniref:C-type lectin domain-containing protein n=1 Tax=Larimichthys crocea TaxID=215358 RepID=A0A6G0IZW2_LARCR|nr:hypothetical protein D5F01_LYC03672 [Larimichthys crocea]
MTYTEEIQMSFPLENPDEDSETFTATEVLNLLLNKTSQENTQLNLLLNKTSQENTQLNLLLNKTSQENTQLNLHLENAIQEKRQLDVENQKLNMFLNSTLENFNLIEEEKKQLNLHLNESLKIITLQGAEKTPCGSHCPPGWTEHASRCFILSHEPKKWENARIECLDYGGDLAMVWNKEDQALLTNMTFQYVQQNPSEDFHSAWIGLQDMVQEGTFYWVNGDTIKWNVIYWMDQEPNNAMDNWDLKGQDCVAIVPPTRIGAEDWLNSWDDSVCEDRRHYICETTALILG